MINESIFTWYHAKGAGARYFFEERLHTTTIRSNPSTMTVSSIHTKLTPGAGHKKLDVFVGKWNTKGQTKAGPNGEALLITGIDTYE